MIAASEPQEFVPSGRQQALRHPGPLQAPSKKAQGLYDEHLLNKFERVSLKEKCKDEWWTLRKAPGTHSKTPVNDDDVEVNCYRNYSQHTGIKSLNSDYLDESSSYRSAEATHKTSKRISDVNFSRISNKLNETKSSCNTNKSTNNRAGIDGTFQKNDEIGYLEDELYVRGNTAIWSRGLVNNCDSLDNGRKTICAYTCAQPIKHALWCTFHCERPTFTSNLIDDYEKIEGSNRTAIPAVCIVDSCNIRVFTPKDEDFVVAIPFQIEKVWTTKYGILIEKEVDSYIKDLDDNRGNLYSLAYPLDEVCPVAVSTFSHNQMLLTSNVRIVYTNENPSICMLYDSQTKQHSVYRIRQLKPTEKLEWVEKTDSTYPSTNLTSKLKSKLSMWDCVKTPSHIPAPSPMNSRPASVTSFSNVHPSTSHSPMATMSRCQSPAPSSVTYSWMSRAARINNSLQYGTTSGVPPYCSFFDCSKSMAHLQASPTICLDYLWTDYFSQQDDNLTEPASKVFLCDDLTGQWYLCYLILTRFQLYLMRIDFSSYNITFGMFTSIAAKDAVPIPKLHMIAILEHNGNVTLYSGLTPVGKLHIGGTLVQHTPSPYVRRSLSRFMSPFPRRSSLLPHCKNVDPKFDDHLLSPVLPEAGARPILQLNFQPQRNLQKSILSGLQDPIENRLTLRYSDGTYYRIMLPSLTSNLLVENCLVALKQCLVRDTASIVLTRWYASKNALGTQNGSLEQEWQMFESLLLELLGYDEEQCGGMTEDFPVTPSSKPKRPKHSTSGSDDDWSFLTNSNYNQSPDYLTQILNLENFQVNRPVHQTQTTLINTNSVLFPYITVILSSFHLLYEDLKLNVLRSSDLRFLAKFLNKLSRDLELPQYSIHYWKDFPDVCNATTPEVVYRGEGKHVEFAVDDEPPNIMQFINDLIRGERSLTVPYPYIANVNAKSKDIIQICGVISKEVLGEISVEALVRTVELTSTQSNPTGGVCDLITNEGTAAEQATILMTERKITLRDLDTFPPAIYLLFYSALWKCREHPPSNWPPDAYYLLWRDDLAAQALKADKETFEDISNQSERGTEAQLQGATTPTKQVDNDQLDGMEDIDNPLIRLRFPEDVRVAEARKLLQSSKPVSIVLVQRPDVSDHDFIEEQEKHLYAICTRTMALSTGRGMFTLRTSTPVITEPLQTPPLCLTGKAPPRGTTVELTHIDTPSNMNLWPLFHNGVANGLRITLDANNIDNTWIVFNKPKAAEQLMEHAGFLMALGLNGHLKNLDVLSTYDYLSKLHEMTSIGILLGLSAALRGTSNMSLTKTLSIHVEALLPPTSMEMDVPQNVQVAALLGVGLVYQGTSQRHIIEVLLSEIGRPPGPEMENSVDRESYSLAAGLALGLVMLKQGECPSGLSDLNVPDTLHYYMVGGNRRPLTGSQRDKYKVFSFQIREGTSVNLDVTAPGATIALGLMYLGTGNKAVADWMAPPDTQYLLDFVRPDFLMFRVLARALILWNDIEPSKEWVENQVPATILPYCMVKPTPNSDIDYEAMNQAYCNIVTGACFALGLKYAGSADPDAFKTLLYFCQMFTRLTVKSIAELAGRPTVETCLNVLLLSTSMVMAGTGNLVIMRLVRLLRWRVGVASSAVVTYGSHLAIHMSLGLLFLGGGRYTLSNSPANIAALICAFYPKFPTHSNDNRYHLQAFRHLYVLAVEPRLVIPRDVHSGNKCYVTLRIVKLDGSTSLLKGPGIVPELNTLSRIAVDDERYWPVIFERGRNWDLLIKILSTSGYVEVKQRAGCLNYIVDKFGYHSQLARTLTQSEAVPWDPQPSSIVSFTHDESIKLFCDQFLTGGDRPGGNAEVRMQQMLTKITYDAAVKDKLVVVPVFTFLIKMIQDLKESPSVLNLWQMRLVSAQVVATCLSNNLIPAEVILALEQNVKEVLDQWDLSQPLLSYLANEGSFSNDVLGKLAAYVTYYDVPNKRELFQGELLEVLCKAQTQLPRVPTAVVKKIHKLCN